MLADFFVRGISGGGNGGADVVGAGGDDDRIADAGVAVVVQLRRDIFAAVDLEFVAFALELQEGLFGVRIRFRIEQRARSDEI